MQTWTAIQIPTSKLWKDNSFRIQTYLFIQNLSEEKQDLPEADVVLECELDPVNHLWDLRDHSESCHPNEILQKETKTLRTAGWSHKSYLSALRCVSWPERCWAGSVWAGCSPWRDRHKQTWARWPWWGWPETSSVTSGPLLHGGWSLHRQVKRWWCGVLSWDRRTLTLL